MRDFHYVWLIWAGAFLIPWVVLFIAAKPYRRFMVERSVFTMPFGLLQPLFVPGYWNPPSLFNLAQRTGFDVESLIFAFSIGGIGSVLCNIATGQKPRAEAGAEEKRVAALRWRVRMIPVVAFVPLVLLGWEPIHAGIAAMGLGAAGKLFVFPEEAKVIWAGGVIFLGLYLVLLLGLKWTVPGYIQTVWNFKAIWPVHPLGMPVEEFLFAFTFGMFCARRA